MPISGPSSYLPTTAEFLEHWEAVNAVVAAPGLVVPGGGTRDILDDNYDTLETQRDLITGLDLDLAVARATRDGLVEALQARMVAFNAKVRGNLAGSPMARALSEAFRTSDAESTVNDALRRMTRLWERIDALSPAPTGLTLPMQLPEGGYARTGLELDREALRVAYRAVSDLEQDLREERERRNDLQEVIYALLKAYRLKVPGEFPAGHALVESLPQLSPTGTRLPDPVVAEGEWQAGPAMARITWEASEDAELARYEVRGVPGAEYVADDESVLTTVLPGAPREFATAFSLGTPGLSASFKVYVVLTTGHERGSEVVTVQRPF